MGIWLIYYGIADANLDTYLHWFEGQHTDEKLARPGYDWASHHEVTSCGMSGHADHVFVAMFGAASSRVFYDPSPAQIKPNQDELTRTMLGYRVKPMSVIMTREWSEYPAGTVNDNVGSPELNHPVADAPFIRLGIFDEAVDDQETGAWCAQTHFPEIANSGKLIAAHKLVSSFGANRHIVIEQYSDQPEIDGAWGALDDSKLHTSPLVAKLR